MHQIFKKHIYRPSIGIHASFRGKYLQLFALAGPESARPATYFPSSCAGVSVFRRVSARLKRATVCAKMFPQPISEPRTIPSFPLRAQNYPGRFPHWSKLRSKCPIPIFPISSFPAAMPDLLCAFYISKATHPAALSY